MQHCQVPFLRLDAVATANVKAFFLTSQVMSTAVSAYPILDFLSLFSQVKTRTITYYLATKSIYYYAPKIV